MSNITQHSRSNLIFPFEDCFLNVWTHFNDFVFPIGSNNHDIPVYAKFLLIPYQSEQLDLFKGFLIISTFFPIIPFYIFLIISCRMFLKCLKMMFICSFSKFLNEIDM